MAKAKPRFHRTPGYCKHGVYTGGCGIDWMCGRCEDGDDTHVRDEYRNAEQIVAVEWTPTAAAQGATPKPGAASGRGFLEVRSNLRLVALLRKYGYDVVITRQVATPDGRWSTIVSHIAAAA